MLFFLIAALMYAGANASESKATLRSLHKGMLNPAKPLGVPKTNALNHFMPDPKDLSYKANVTRALFEAGVVGPKSREYHGKLNEKLMREMGMDERSIDPRVTNYYLYNLQGAAIVTSRTESYVSIVNNAQPYLTVMRHTMVAYPSGSPAVATIDVGYITNSTGFYKLGAASTSHGYTVNFYPSDSSTTEKYQPGSTNGWLKKAITVPSYPTTDKTELYGWDAPGTGLLTNYALTGIGQAFFNGQLSVGAVQILHQYQGLECGQITMPWSRLQWQSMKSSNAVQGPYPMSFWYTQIMSECGGNWYNSYGPNNDSFDVKAITYVPQ